MKKISLFLSLLFALACTINAQTARVQIIHNSPTPTVDIYANADRLLDNFAYRTATPYIDVPAGVNIDLGVALANSNSASDALVTFPVTFDAGKTYVVVATGTVGGSPGFDLAVTDMGMEMAPSGNEVSIAFYHGTPDAPEVDIVAGGNPIFDDVTYGNFAPYVTVPAGAYDLQLTPGNDNNNILGNYYADVDFWKGNTMVVFASGFLGDSPSFQPWVALSNGGTYPLPGGLVPPPPGPQARVQIIHNSPTPTVDIWANNDLLLNDFAFRTATPYLTVPAGVQIDLGVALRNSTAASDAIANFPVTFEDGKTYVVVANGIVGGTPGFGLDVFDMGKETAPSANEVSVLFFHGSPDAPEVDIVAGGSPVFDNTSYGEFNGYLDLPAGSYDLDVTPANDNNTIVARYSADLSFWRGQTLVVFASGFLDGSNPSFVPYVALSNGGTFPLPTRPVIKGNGSSARGTAGLSSADVFPNPASAFATLQLEATTTKDVQIRIADGLGRLVQTTNQVLQKGTNQIDLELNGFEKGLYIIQIQDAMGILSTQKLIVK